ncbi:hypothetical protein C7E25_11300, partial [Stenotrophomonas maltophilia]
MFDGFDGAGWAGSRCVSPLERSIRLRPGFEKRIVLTAIIEKFECSSSASMPCRSWMPSTAVAPLPAP